MKLIFLIILIDTCYSQLDGEFWWLKNDNTKKDTTKDLSETSTFVNMDRSFDSKVVPPSSLTKREVVCCECVNFILCINGTINTDGTGLIDVRIGGEPTVNVDVCPGEFDVCCNVPDADPSCQKLDNKLTSTEASETYFTPHPESNCECVSYSTCSPHLVVSDGLGKTSIELSNGRMVNHSKCMHALDVCCFLPEIFLGNETEFFSPSEPPIERDTCECVSPFLCTPDGFIRTDGEGLLDLRFGPAKPLKKCPTNPDLLCCLPPPAEINETEPSLPTPLERSPPECGQRNKNGVGVRILGFKEGQTQFGEFPWVAMVLKKELIMDVVQPLFLGGASLIHPRVILTAAHKVDGVPWGNLLVRLGEWDTMAEKEYLPYQDIAVKEVVFHPGFVKQTLFHDVALLILEEEANQQYNIWPICPAKSLDDVNESSCVINGWGVDAFNFGEYQRIMKSITLPLVRREKCQELLRNTRLSRHFRLHSSFICAGGEEGMDACKGDGGGPLACQRLDDPTKYVQVGITAWGIGCGTKDVPGVYADVVSHYNWITNNVNRIFPESTPPTPGFEPPTLTPGIKDNATIMKEKRRKQREKRRERQRKIRQQRRNRRKQNRNRMNTE